jgi:hypothetical protein
MIRSVPNIIKIGARYRGIYLPVAAIKLSRYRPGQALGVPGG